MYMLHCLDLVLPKKMDDPSFAITCSNTLREDYSPSIGIHELWLQIVPRVFIFFETCSSQVVMNGVKLLV